MVVVVVVMEGLVELAQVLVMILALVLVMVDQEACMEIGQAIVGLVAVVDTIHMPDRCYTNFSHRCCCQVSWLLLLVAQS